MARGARLSRAAVEVRSGEHGGAGEGRGERGDARGRGAVGLLLRDDVAVVVAVVVVVLLALVLVVAVLVLALVLVAVVGAVVRVDPFSLRDGRGEGSSGRPISPAGRAAWPAAARRRRYCRLSLIHI